MLKKFVLVLMCLVSVNAYSASSQEQFDTMMSAIENNNIKVVNQLIAHKVDLNMRTDSRASPTFCTYAAYLGRLPILAALLDAGADIELTDADLHTPLLSAIMGNQPDTVDFLIVNGANVNAQNRWGQSAYLLAKDYPQVLNLLP
jgi:ankyrin repeat protein